MSPSYRGFRPYVSVAQRRRRAAREVAALKKKGRSLSPVAARPRSKIATTFWGEAWCENLEAYRDYENRLPRGKTYVRNGSVVDLQIAPGRVTALVSGSELYEVEVRIDPLTKGRWSAITEQCAGKIDSVVELLAGSISGAVMEITARHGEGLFPTPGEIRLGCSCPDWAEMCKHVAAALYGVGARLDETPEHLFTLRGVDPSDLVVAAAAQGMPRARGGHARILDEADLGDVFGIDIDIDSSPASPAAPTRKRSPARKKPAPAKKARAKKKAPEMSPASRRAAKRPARKRTAKKKPATKNKPSTTTKAATKKAATRRPGKKPATQKAPAKKGSSKTAKKKPSGKPAARS